MTAHHKRALSFTTRTLLIIIIGAIALLLGFLQNNPASSSANFTPTASLQNGPETINPTNAQNLIELDRLGRGTMTDMAWSPDGELLAVSSELGVEIFYADLLGSPAFKVLPRHLSGANTLAFSPDGRLLATGSGVYPIGDFDQDNAVQMWDTATWELKYTFVAHSAPVTDIAFSPNGELFATGSRYGLELDDVQLWDTSTGSNIGSFTGKSRPIAFSPVGNQLAIGNEASIEVWDYTSLELLKTLENNAGELENIAFSPDGKVLAIYAGTITLWDIEQQLVLDTFFGRRKIAFSSDGTQLIYFDLDYRIISYDMNLHEHQQIAVVSILTSVLTFKPNTDILALASIDGGIALLNILTRETIIYHSGYQYPITSLVFDTDGTHLSAAGSNPIPPQFEIHGTAARQWNISTREEVILAENESLDSMAVFASPSDTALILGSDLDRQAIWDVGNETVLMDLMDNDVWVELAVGPNGDIVALGINDHTFRLYDATTGTEVYQSSRLPSHIQSLTFNQDGTLLAIGQDNGTITIFNIEEQSIVHEFTHIDELDVPTLSFGADNYLASGDYFGNIELWDFRTEELLFLHEGYAHVTALTFSADGSILVSGDSDGIIKLFDTADGSELISIQAHSPEFGAITAITFNPTGTMIAVGSNDGTISLWGIPSN